MNGYLDWEDMFVRMLYWSHNHSPYKVFRLEAKRVFPVNYPVSPSHSFILDRQIAQLITTERQAISLTVIHSTQHRRNMKIENQFDLTSTFSVDLYSHLSTMLDDTGKITRKVMNEYRASFIHRSWSQSDWTFTDKDVFWSLTDLLAFFLTILILKGVRG